MASRINQSAPGSRILLIIFTFLLPAAGETTLETSSRVRLDPIDRGYQDIVVAIHNDVEESSDLLDGIKDAFTAASSVLHTATRSLTYFKEIRILVPPSWSDSDEYQQPAWENYASSDVRIAHYDNGQPRTIQVGLCGDPGSHIELTPGYLMNEQDDHARYGAPGKVIVHEWSHLRYGVFDEHASLSDPNDQPFYFHPITERVEATRCAESITGEILSVMGGSCTSYIRGLPSSTQCYFHDETNDVRGDDLGSLMYKVFLDRINHFCDDGGYGPLKHNPHAKNKHNRLCVEKSVWEVILEHEDFSGTQNLDVSPRDVTTPTFVIVKENRVQCTTVLVLDTSGSMSDIPQRLQLLRQASKNIIKDLLPDGSRLGIVEFSSTARTRHQITEIVSSAIRTDLENALPIIGSGRTSIGAGLAKALDLFEAESEAARQKLILITDGEQNQRPFIADVLNDVVEANIELYTVAVGPDADADLERISSLTGGEHFSHADSSSDLFLSLSQVVTDCDTSGTVISATLEADYVTIPAGGNYSINFYIEEALTGGLKIIIGHISDADTDTEVALQDPSGNIIDSSSDLVTSNLAFNELEIDINQQYTQSGNWVLVVINRQGSNVDHNIVVQPRVLPGATPIMVNAFWARTSVTPPERQILYVAVFRDSTPVINADVTALVRLNVNAVNNTVILMPRDDGAEPDATRDDGIYSAYFTSFIGGGRYGVEVKVKARENTQFLHGLVVGAGAAVNPLVNGILQPEIISYENTGKFQRQIIGGSFECQNITKCSRADADLYPPSRIIDLAATHVDPENFTIELTFTSPGDDLSDGSASQYEIRYSTNFTALRENFYANKLVPADWFVVGNTHTPAVSGTKEVFIIRANEIGSISYSFAIVAIDERGNANERSNIVTSSGSLLFRTDGTKDMTLYIIIGVIAGLVIIFVVVLRTVCCRGNGGTSIGNTPSSVFGLRNRGYMA